MAARHHQETEPLTIRVGEIARLIGKTVGMGKACGVKRYVLTAIRKCGYLTIHECALTPDERRRGYQLMAQRERIMADRQRRRLTGISCPQARRFAIWMYLRLLR